MKLPNKSEYVAILCPRCGEFKLRCEFGPAVRVCLECLALKLLDVTVRPRQLPLTGCSIMWEFTLMNQGFNELPGIQQYGVVKRAFDTGEIEIYWPHVDRTSFVFPDEIELPWEDM